MKEYVKVKHEFEGDIKIWRVYNYLSYRELQDELAEQIEEENYKIPATEINEKYDDLDIDEFLKTPYTLIVEINEPRFKQG